MLYDNNFRTIAIKDKGFFKCAKAMVFTLCYHWQRFLKCIKTIIFTCCYKWQLFLKCIKEIVLTLLLSIDNDFWSGLQQRFLHCCYGRMIFSIYPFTMSHNYSNHTLSWRVVIVPSIMVAYNNGLHYSSTLTMWCSISIDYKMD